MKKNVLLSLFILLGVFQGYSQRYNSEQNYGSGFFSRFYRLKIGFKFSPGFIINSVNASKNFKTFYSKGVNVRLSVGPVFDMYITDKYAFSTGLWYTVKSVNYTMHGSFYDNELFKNTPLTKEEIRGTESNFDLQYLQLPFTMKIFSDQIVQDIPLFLQFGGTLDLKIAEKALDKSRNALAQYQERLVTSQSIFGLGDVGLLLGIGGEKSINRGGDAFFFGIQYQRGLTEINSAHNFADLATKNGAFYLDFGVKF